MLDVEHDVCKQIILENRNFVIPPFSQKICHRPGLI